MRDPSRLLVLAALLLIGCGGASSTVPTAPTAPTVDLNVVQTPEGTVGEFVGAGGHDASGGLSLLVEGGQASLELGSDFFVSAVPGPVVYLNTTNDVHTGMPLRVGALQRNVGSQAYTFAAPDGVSYTWVLVWCEPFDVPVAEASIPATP